MSDSWFVKDLIKHIRVDHNLTEESTWEECLSMFDNFSAVSREILGRSTISISSPTINAEKLRLISGISIDATVVSTSAASDRTSRCAFVSRVIPKRIDRNANITWINVKGSTNVA